MWWKLIFTKSSKNKLGWFLTLWLIVNIIQAACMELNEDEAYYWVYSQFLDFGYYDHPPMIALFINAGDRIFQNTLGVRIISIIASTFSIFVLWKIVKEYAVNAYLFILLFLSFILFHVYGFIATPDSPLFFFSVLFFYCYQRYLKQDNYKWALLLAIVIAGLLYSKYHGVLILFFTILSNLKLLRRASFWIVVILVLLFYLPHILWQLENGLPSIYHHLLDRYSKAYHFSFTTEFILGQIFVAAPLVGWYYFFAGVKVKSDDQFLRTLKFSFYGIFILFILSTFKARVEAHWTLLGFLPLFILTYIFISLKNPIPKWLIPLITINVILIIILRLIFILPFSYFKKNEVVEVYTGNKEWAKNIKDKADTNFVLFNQGYQEASNYNFYNRTTKGFSYNNRNERKNQFDIWPIEDSLRGKNIYFVGDYGFDQNIIQDSITTVKGKYYGRWIENVRIYQKVKIEVGKISPNWKKDEKRNLDIIIYNPYKEDISFSNKDQIWKCFFEYAWLSKGEIIEVTLLKDILEQISIPSKKSKGLTVNIKAPSKPGKYQLIFSLRTEPLDGTRNSKLMSIEVK